MEWWDKEKCIDYYCGEYKKSGLFGKKYSIELYIYPSRIEGKGFEVYDNDVVGNEIQPFDISFRDVREIYINEIKNEKALIIYYNDKTVITNKKVKIALLGMSDFQKWYDLVEKTYNDFTQKKMLEHQIELEKQEEENRLIATKEENALKFYNDCYSFHIKETTPIYQLFSEKNKIALIYIDENKSMNFLKIDGYEQEENNGVIEYQNIHYYEKAGSISYTTDIHGNYSSYGGSMTGGKFSKLATVGGGLLFGFMGMAVGAALTYKPAKQEPINTSFSINSDVKKIDDRSVILNFYSDIKKQYIDIELPQDIYNFFQTYLPEKKYNIVDELEKKTVVHQSSSIIENGSFLKTSVKTDRPSIEVKESAQDNSLDAFKQKVEKLKLMKDAGLLSDEEFNTERTKLLNMI